MSLILEQVSPEVQGGRQSGQQKPKEKDRAIPDQPWAGLSCGRDGGTAGRSLEEKQAILCFIWVYKVPKNPVKTARPWLATENGVLSRCLSSHLSPS